MSEHHSGPVEVGAEKDYAEHDKTYHGFINAAKYGSISIAVLMICMATFFFTKAGGVFSFLLFIVLNLIAFFIL